MRQLHGLLRQQVEGLDPEMAVLPNDWQHLVDGVNAAYWRAERERDGLRAQLVRREQELRQARAELEAVTETFPDLLIRLDAFGTILEHRAGVSVDLPMASGSWVGRHVRDALSQQ